ncbi:MULTISPECIES: ABC transporter permease [Sutcliffiella]|nr:MULTISPECIES: ABC transporter permease subunit [Sutcliffiella]MED4014970.1 ABC transporter permease subunit [Sutcliffiella cohnii]WBL17297.1 ABC transporter permease subunit [Sutcliffiella sp. NC1]
MMINLIKNECIKWFKRPSFYVMSSILVGLSVLGLVFVLLLDNMPSSADGPLDWRQQLESDNETYSEILESNSFGDISYYERQIALNEYRLENNLPPTENYSVWNFIEDNIGLSSIITLFVIIIAGGMVASEFSWGTIKLLMIRPIKRSKILLSKYIAVLIFTFIFFSLLFVSSFIVGAIFFGFESQPSLQYFNGEVFVWSPFAAIVFKLFLQSIAVMMYATIAFMISSVFRNNSLAIGISIFLYFTGTTVTQLVGMKYEWAKFSPFANINFESVIQGSPLVEGTTLLFSIVMFLLYFIVFHVISFTVFTKRDIAA